MLKGFNYVVKTDCSVYGAHTFQEAARCYSTTKQMIKKFHLSTEVKVCNREGFEISHEVLDKEIKRIKQEKQN